MYIPREGEEGLSILVPAVRDFLAQDAKLLALLGGGPDESIVGEGLFTEETPTPAILISTIAEGETYAGESTQLIRLIIYAINRNRGYYAIEKILARLKRLLKSDDLWDFLEFPQSANFAVLGVNAPGTTASTTLPRYSAEGRGVYVFVTTVVNSEEDGAGISPPPPPPIPGTGRLSFSPTLLGATVDVPNPFRGLGWWRGAPRYVPDVTTETEYQRFTWDQLETSGGGINLAPLNTFVAGAVSRGRRAAFRVQAYVPGDTARRVPSDIPTTVVSGSHIPQWNHASFIPRLNALMTAIAAQYNGNASIAYMDIGVYGRWGEWHMYSVEAYAATEAVQRQIIDAHTNNFPNTQLVMLTDSDFALGYVGPQTHAIPIGLRRDSWGHTTQFDAFAVRPNYLAYWTNRWQTAPFVVEPYAGGSFVFNTTVALQQVNTYHLSNAGNANIPGLFTDLPSGDQGRWREIQAKLGYRFAAETVVVDFDAGTIAVAWRNSGAARLHEAAVVKYRAGATSVTSALNLKGVSSTVSDTVALPSLSAGTHAVTILVTINGVPINLAQSGEQLDGSYLVGSVVIA